MEEFNLIEKRIPMCLLLQVTNNFVSSPPLFFLLEFLKVNPRLLVSLEMLKYVSLRIYFNNYCVVVPNKINDFLNIH